MLKLLHQELKKIKLNIEARKGLEIMAKKLNNNELSNVNGGVVQPVVQQTVDGNIFQCLNTNCNNTWSDHTLTCCPKCGSTRFQQIK